MENQNSIQVESKKKKKKLPIIILIIIGALLLMIGAVVLTIMLKLGKMSKNSVGTVPTPADLPDVTAEPVELVPVGDPSELDLSEEYDPDIIDMEFGNDPIFERDTIDANVVNILLLGNDARDEYDHGRADTIMILSFNKQTRTIKLVSILRDTWIYIPGRDKWNRINAAYQFGGTGLAINTINLNFDLDIQYYMRVDFNSLKSIVNELGGIDIELTEREVEYINNGCGGEDLPVHAGWHHLNGEQALCHARNRKIGNADWSRTERQRKVMYAMFNKAKQLKDVPALTSLVNRMIGYVETNLSAAQIVSLGISVIFGGSVEPMNRSMPFEGTWQYAYEGKMAVIHIVIPANAAKLHQYLYEQ